MISKVHTGGIIMHRLRAIFVASALLSTGFAQGKDASATLPELCAKYRNQLLAWSTQCEAEKLFTMADRLNREVLEWGGDSDQCKILHHQQVKAHATYSKEHRDAYRKFVKSAAFTKKTSKFLRAREAFDKKFARRMFALAEDAVAAQQSKAAMNIIERAMMLTDSLPKGSKRGVKRVWDAHKSRQRYQLSIDHLELGTTLGRSPLVLNDLKGKVVLWRSKSL